jgi:hypothetical protein
LLTSVACMRPAAELPHQPTVDRAKGQLTRFGHGPSAFDVVQNPLQFGGRKIRVDQQTGFLLHHGRKPSLTQAQALGFGAAVLPNDGVVDGLAGVTPPHHRGFALVGDAHGGDLVGTEPCLLQNLSGGGKLAGPNFLWVVFDPTRLGVDLAKLLLD